MVPMGVIFKFFNSMLEHLFLVLILILINLPLMNLPHLLDLGKVKLIKNEILLILLEFLRFF